MKHRKKTRRIICLSGFSALLVAGVVFLSSCGPPTAGTNLRFSISYPESVDEGPLTGRMILVIESR